MKKKLSEEQIDDIVISQAENDSEWEEPIHASKKKATSFSIPADFASIATFLANMHRETGVEEWLMHIIRERVEL